MAQQSDAQRPGSFGEPVVRMQHIYKNFKSVQALEDVSFQLAAGEIRGLVGENGAGKSTLMNILYGLFGASKGSIECFGKQLPSRWTSIQAIQNGIGMIHQHFSTVPVYTVLENVVLPTLRWNDFRPDWKACAEKISKLANEYDFHLDMHQKVETLSVGEKQQLEILKALYQGAKILILDEPTGVLTPQQAENLLKFLVELKQKGLSVVLVTHKLFMNYEQEIPCGENIGDAEALAAIRRLKAEAKNRGGTLFPLHDPDWVRTIRLNPEYYD